MVEGQQRGAVMSGASRRVTLAWVVGLVAGCAAQPNYNIQRLAGELPVGTRLEVATPFAYPGGRTTLWFQSGEIKDSRHLNLWDWHCSLDLYLSERSDQRREFNGGGFLVTGWREERLDQLFVWEEDYTLGMILVLSVPQHPAVRQLRCERRFRDRSRERPLSTADLRAALGGYFAVRLRDRTVEPSAGSIPAR